MKIAIVGLAIVAMASAIDFDSIVKTVNSAQTTWKASNKFTPNKTMSVIKNMMGTKLDSNGIFPSTKKYSGAALPDEFDARVQWPECPTIAQVRDQGNCGSCWAVAGAGAFSDRVCIASNGKFTLPLSAEQLLSCCWYCGQGCDGGYPAMAWEYFVFTGLVSGGEYDSGTGCVPYSIEACEHHSTASSRPQCDDLPDASTPSCPSKCSNSNYGTTFGSDSHKSSGSYGFDSVEAIQENLMNYGSVEAGFTVYEDFLTYESGVYQHVTGNQVGGHAVRVIGWGTENGTPYWLVANSWNSDWADGGLFKIIRGTDEGGFDSAMVAGDVSA